MTALDCIWIIVVRETNVAENNASSWVNCNVCTKKILLSFILCLLPAAQTTDIKLAKILKYQYNPLKSKLSNHNVSILKKNSEGTKYQVSLIANCCMVCQIFRQQSEMWCCYQQHPPRSCAHIVVVNDNKARRLDGCIKEAVTQQPLPELIFCGRFNIKDVNIKMSS